MKNIIFVISLIFILAFAACTKMEEQPKGNQTIPFSQLQHKSGEDDDLPIINEQTRKKDGSVASNVKVTFIDSNQDSTYKFTDESGYAQIILSDFGEYDLYLESPLFQPVHDVVIIVDTITNRTDTLEYQ